MKRLIKADAVELDTYGYDRKNAEMICKTVLEGKGLDFNSLNLYLPPSHKDAFTGCFSENFNYAIEYYAYQNENKKKFFVVILMYDINNNSNYKTEYKEVDALTDINFNNFEMNGEKFVRKNNHSAYEKFLEEQEEQPIAAKIKRLKRVKTSALDKNLKRYNRKNIYK